MIGLIINTFNRPEYLKECFYSIKRSSIPKDTLIVIIDDKSTDAETLSLVNDFCISDCTCVKIFKQENEGIKKSLLSGYEYCFYEGCDTVINLDGDCVVRNDFIEKILALKSKFQNDIITGFNCLTKNKNGSDRHFVIEQGIDYNIKKSVGGCNMCIDKLIYENHVKPSLLKPIGNWDNMACISSGKAICCVPSVVNHIGIKSSMNHTSGGEPPDTAEDFKPLSLPNVTLIGIDSFDFGRLKLAADRSCENIEFGAVKLFGKELNIKSKQEYSIFIIKKLAEYIDTDYLLIIQHDGYILNWKAWNNDWLKFDYIGAAWEWYRDDFKTGNGGFSLRSKKLHAILKNDSKIIPKNDNIIHHLEEDHNICRIYRPYLEKEYGIKFAPVEVANKFSIEAWASKNNIWNGQFGFHGNHVKLPTEV